MKGKRFSEIAKDELDRAVKRGENPSAEEALDRAADRILEGFSDPTDARDFVDAAKKRDMIFCDGYGYTVGWEAVDAALAWRRTTEILEEDGNDELSKL